MNSSDLHALEAELQAEGYVRDTPAFEVVLLRRKVEYCQADKGVAACQHCGYFDYCQTAKDLLMQQRYQPPTKSDTTLVVEDKLPDWVFPPEIKANGAVPEPRIEDATGARSPGPAGKR